MSSISAREILLLPIAVHVCLVLAMRTKLNVEHIRPRYYLLLATVWRDDLCEVPFDSSAMVAGLLTFSRQNLTFSRQN